MKKVYATTNAPGAIGPYSQAVQAGTQRKKCLQVLPLVFFSASVKIPSLKSPT